MTEYSMDRLDTCSDDEHDDNDDERGVTHAEELREVIAYFHARVDRSVEPLVFAPATNDTDELSASHASIRALLVKAGKRHRDVKASLDAKLAAADAKERGRAEETQSFVAKLNAEVAEVREELAMLPDTAGTRSVCEMYADMEDEMIAERDQTSDGGARGVGRR